MSKQVYIDMDGTLCRFHDTEHKYIEAMWEQGFYLNLKPFENLVEAINLFKTRNPHIELYILSAVLDTDPPFIAEEKRQWLQEHLPEIQNENIIFVPAGADKSEYIKKINSECFLIDDYNKNLRDWSAAGGHSIKFQNDINNKGLGAYGGESGHIWDGECIKYNDNPTQICVSIEYAMKIIDKKQERTGNIFYGFESDVLPSMFIKKLEERIITHKYEETNLSEACATCIDACLKEAAANQISYSKLLGWMQAAVRLGYWDSVSVNPSSIKTYINFLTKRDIRFEELSALIQVNKSLKEDIQNKLFMPKTSSLSQTSISNLKNQLNQCEKKLSALEKEWEDIAKTKYPKIPFGNSVIPYSKYNQRIHRNVIQTR